MYEATTSASLSGFLISLRDTTASGAIFAYIEEYSSKLFKVSRTIASNLSSAGKLSS